MNYPRLVPKEQNLLGGGHLIMIDGELSFTPSTKEGDEQWLFEQGNRGYAASVTPLVIPDPTSCKIRQSNVAL